MKFIQVVKEMFNQKESVLAVFVDFKAAYDTVWRNKLFLKLNKMKVKGNMLQWLIKFVSQRWPTVRY